MVDVTMTAGFQAPGGPRRPPAVLAGGLDLDEWIIIEMRDRMRIAHRHDVKVTALNVVLNVALFIKKAPCKVTALPPRRLVPYRCLIPSVRCPVSTTLPACPLSA